MARIQLSGLTKFYGKRRGVEDVTLEVADQEFLTVFGPAGAGKTTTLNLIAGIVTPDRGSIRIGDRSVDGLEPADRNVAMVFESYTLYPQFTVYQNMAFPLRSPKHRLPATEVEQRVRHFATMLKIDHLLDRPIQALSNGQRQRTALGRALVRRPDVFLMDEPLSHLDAKLRHSMRAELKEMRGQLGTTTIYVTHDYLEAMSLGDRVAVINHGEILQIGTPEESISVRPRSKWLSFLAIRKSMWWQPRSVTDKQIRSACRHWAKNGVSRLLRRSAPLWTRCPAIRFAWAFGRPMSWWVLTGARVARCGL